MPVHSLHLVKGGQAKNSILWHSQGAGSVGLTRRAKELRGRALRGGKHSFMFSFQQPFSSAELPCQGLCEICIVTVCWNRLGREIFHCLRAYTNPALHGVQAGMFITEHNVNI